MSRIKTCVSLYSLQDEYLNHRMDLEACLHYVKECGAEGVEILPDQMIKNTPNPSEEDLAKWHQYISDTGLTPVIADVFLNTNLYKNRSLTHKECIDLLVKEIQLADKMGIRMIRLAYAASSALSSAAGMNSLISSSATSISQPPRF